jgi:hypothetical protein
MIRLLSTLALAAAFPLTSSAGILVDAKGNPTEGAFTINAGSGLLFKPAGGAAGPIKAGNFKALEIDLRDQVWPDDFRKSAKVEIGLLGTYFERTNLEGPRRERIDDQVNFNWGGGSPFKDWRVDHFSVRWTGKLQVNKTGDYQFFTTSDDGVRLEIGGKKLINNWSEHSTAEDKTKIRLEKDRDHEIRIEYFENTGEAIMRVEFIGPDKKRRKLGELLLSPPDNVAGRLDLPILTNTGLKPGIILRDGSVLSAQIKQANDTAFVLGKPFDDLTISTFNIARVVFREIPAKTAAAAQSNRKGALLVGGDFVDGEFKSYERGMLKMSSLLFGYQTLETKFETHALLMREPKADNSAWRVRDYRGNVLLAESIRFAGPDLIVTSPILKDLRLPLSQVYRIDGGNAADLYPQSLRLGPTSIHARKDAKITDDERRRTDSLKRLASREKDKLLRTESMLKRTINDEKEKLLDAKDRESGHLLKVAKARDKFAGAEAEFKAYSAKYDEAAKISSQLATEYQASDREYNRVKGLESRALSSVKARANEVSRLQSYVKRYNRKGSEVQHQKYQADLAKKQKEYAATKTAVVDAQRATRAAADRKTKLYRSSDTARRTTAKAKGDRESKRRSMDSYRRTVAYEEGHLKSAQAKVSAALKKVEGRKTAELR